jgi:release factor glutamine methyltransferase
VTIHARVAAGRERLRAAGISPDEADLDARLLAEYVLGWTTERFFVDANDSEPDGFAARFDALIARRSAREPFAYIVGHQEFWGLTFEVTPAVLIPRPETELLVEVALAFFPDGGPPVRLCDVGTGSGCVAIAIARDRRAVSIVAVDLSSAALEVARRNAERNGVASNVTFLKSDLFAATRGSFDAILSNPPYVAERDRATTQPEVRDYEPGVALFAGADGLDAIRRLVVEAPSRLDSGGYLIFEFGFGQADAVAGLISRSSGLTMIELRRDLQDIPRTAIARRA